MPRLDNNRILPYKIDILYRVITDVEKYSVFIPWCKDVTIVSKNDSEIISDVTVEFLFIKEKYRSIAVFEKPKKNKEETIAKASIEMIEGPFSHFSTVWILNSLDDNKTLVDFTCDFSFNNTIYDGIASTVLMSANEKIINSFIKRASFVSKES